MANCRINFISGACFVLQLFAASLSAIAAPLTCLELLESSPVPQLFDANLPAVKPEHFLSKDFLARLRAEQGEVQARINRISPDVLEFQIFTERGGARPLVEFEMHRDPERPWSMQIDQLRLENPFEDGQNGRLKLNQERQGLPFKEVRQLRVGFFALVRKEGFRELRTTGANNFVVFMFYRYLGMVPETEASAKTVALLENSFRHLSKSLPEDERPRSFNAFASLAGHWYKKREIPYSVEAAWSFYRQSGELWAGFELLKLADDTIVGLRHTRENPDHSVSKNIYLIDATKKDLPFLQWQDLAQSGDLALRFDLTSTYQK